MIFKIRNELTKQCAQCSEECNKQDCIIYRLKKIMEMRDIEVAEIDIEEFFETDNTDQIGMVIE